MTLDQLMDKLAAIENYVAVDNREVYVEYKGMLNNIDDIKIDKENVNESILIVVN